MAAKVTTREILFVRGNANIPPRVHRIPLTKKPIGLSMTLSLLLRRTELMSPPTTSSLNPERSFYYTDF